MSENQPKKLLEMREEPKKPRLSANAKKEIREWITSLIVALVAVLIIRAFLFTIIRVDGYSMLDTLHNGDRLYVSVLTPRLNGYERGDIVICHYPNRRENFVKRIIALPGDTVEVRGGALYINGQLTEEPYLSEERTQKFHGGLYDFKPVELSEDQYFVMGDHRDDSNDSRRVGPITGSMLVGEARCILWPLNRIGGVE